MSGTQHRYFIVNKPYNMVSQFVSPDNVRLLCDLGFSFPEGTHAVGRLDNHSEGLLLLTTNKKVTRLLFQGEVPHKRTYLVRVKRIVTEEALLQLRKGVPITAPNGAIYTTSPCEAEIVQKPIEISYKGPDLWEELPHTWLLITLTEGRFHQVRKMVAAVKHKCERLIRFSIEDLKLGAMLPGEVCEIQETEFFRLLKISYIPTTL